MKERVLSQRVPFRPRSTHPPVGNPLRCGREGTDAVPPLLSKHIELPQKLRCLLMNLPVCWMSQLLIEIQGLALGRKEKYPGE